MLKKQIVCFRFCELKTKKTNDKKRNVEFNNPDQSTIDPLIGRSAAPQQRQSAFVAVRSHNVWEKGRDAVLEKGKEKEGAREGGREETGEGHMLSRCARSSE